MRAERFDERTAANVATASTSVPAPVTSEEIVDQEVARRGTTLQFVKREGPPRTPAPPTPAESRRGLLPPRDSNALHIRTRRSPRPASLPAFQPPRGAPSASPQPS